MAVDIAPELYEKIQADFQRRIKLNKKIRSFQKHVKDNSATAKEVSLYSAELGKCASAALTRYLTADNLPYGLLYWNIAEKTIKPLLFQIYEMVNEAGEAVQNIENNQLGIKVNAVRADFPESRVNDLLNKLMDYSKEIFEDGQ